MMELRQCPSSPGGSSRTMDAVREFESRQIFMKSAMPGWGSGSDMRLNIPQSGNSKNDNDSWTGRYSDSYVTF